MLFEQIGKGFLAAAVTPAAEEYAAGDMNKLVAVAFARMLSERELDFIWHEDGHFDVGPLYEIEPRHVACPDNYYPTHPSERPYILIGHHLPPPTNLIVLLGVGRTTALTDTDPPSRALSISEWLLSFPSQWKEAA
jgi:hypothetical protein